MFSGRACSATRHIDGSQLSICVSPKHEVTCRKVAASLIYESHEDMLRSFRALLFVHAKLDSEVAACSAYVQFVEV